MDCVLSVKVFLFYVVLGLVSGDVWYEAQFTETILSCKDFDNKIIQADGITMGMTEGSDDEEPGFGLSGPLKIENAIDDSLNVNMNIYKATEVGEEYMFKSAMNLCSSMQDTDTPWWPIFQMMNISCCPIAKGSYQLQNLVLSIDAFSELLSHDFCGEYSVELSLVKDIDEVVSCHLIQVAIVEHEKDE